VRCMGCGAEMILMKVIPDDSMPVPGFERHAYMCAACLYTENRLMFNKPPPERESEAVSFLAALAAPPIAPASTVQHEAAPAQSFWGRMFAKARGR
jgi:hypothetical protein